MADKVSCRIIMESSALKVLDMAQMLALSTTGDEVLTRLKNKGVIPFKSGTMQNDQTYVDDSGRMGGRVSIATASPQARRLYYHPEYKFTHSSNADAGAHWFDSIQGGNDIAEIYAEQFKRLGRL